MGIVWKLATGASFIGSEVAESAKTGGFGLNFDILEANVINLAIVIGILFYFGRNFLGKVLGDRQGAIQSAIQEAEQKKKRAAISLAEEQQKLAQAQAEADKIRSSADEAAKVARAEILAKSEQEIQRMRENSARDLSSEQERVIRDLRQRIVELALKQAEAEIPGRLDASKQQELVNRSIEFLGGR